MVPLLSYHEHTLVQKLLSALMLNLEMKTIDTFQHLFLAVQYNNYGQTLRVFSYLHQSAHLHGPKVIQAGIWGLPTAWVAPKHVMDLRDRIQNELVSETGIW